MKKRRDLVKAVLAAGGVGLGLGAAGRGLLGIFSARPSDITSSPNAGAAMPAMLRIPTHDSSEDEKERPFRKVASVSLVDISRELARQQRPLEKIAGDLAKEAADPVGAVAEALPVNVRASDARQSSIGIPSIFAAGGGGLVGGWSLMDWLLKKQRRAQQSAEVDDAKEDYRQALREQYLMSMMSKRSDDRSHGNLDEVYDRYDAIREKRGNSSPTDMTMSEYAFPGPLPYIFGNRDIGQKLQGALYTAMLAAAGGSAYGTYQWAKGRNNQKLLEKAIKLRARRRAGPQAMYAIPTSYDDDEEI